MDERSRGNSAEELAPRRTDLAADGPITEDDVDRWAEHQREAHTRAREALVSAAWRDESEAAAAWHRAARDGDPRAAEQALLDADE
jgi:hypothetical protein